MISSGRLAALQSTFAAWNTTGFPFLRLDEGVITPLENNYGGDAELFYFVPLIARKCGISIEQALWFWDIGFTCAGSALAVSGFWYLATTKIQRLVALIGICAIGFVVHAIGDTYIAPFVAASCIPWVFIFLKNSQFSTLGFYSFFAGLVIALTNSIRIFGGYTLGIVLVVGTAVRFRQFKKTLLVFLLLSAGVKSYHIWFFSLMNSRNNYLVGQSIPYGAYKLEHVFWHTIYVGCGFITNEYDICYRDSCAFQKAREIDPAVNYCSAEYDALLRKETLQFCYDHPHFVLRTLFAKAGVLFYYLLLFGNIGLVCAYFYRKPWYLEVPYGLALMFSALPGLATIPIAPYLTGFFAVATFYGIHSIIWALQHGLVRDLRALCKRFFF